MTSVNYVTLDVFTDKRFKGNQVAIVDVPSPLPTTHMQIIAREFNFSETVFLHRPSSPDEPPSVNIFTPVNEMDFAGHPVIGTGHALFRNLLPGPGSASESEPESVPTSLDIKIKAGTVTLAYDPQDQIVTAQVPHNVHVHSVRTPKSALIATQPSLASHALEDSFPAVSIVKGVTYILADLTPHPSAFSAIKPGPCPTVPLDEAWAPSFVGVMYYRLIKTGADEPDTTKVWWLRVRMIAIDLEDPACGSGSCALAVYLALGHGEADGKYRFYLDQGSEIGRDSSIIVDVVLDGSGKGVRSVTLSGKAAPVTEGKMLLP